MNHPVLVQETQSNQNFPNNQANMMFSQWLSSRLAHQHHSISGPDPRTKVLILPPSANSMMIQTLGPSIKLP